MDFLGKTMRSLELLGKPITGRVLAATQFRAGSGTIQNGRASDTRHYFIGVYVGSNWLFTFSFSRTRKKFYNEVPA